MKPKHFWWLMESAASDGGEKKTVSKTDRDAILEALNGNPKGSFW